MSVVTRDQTEHFQRISFSEKGHELAFGFKKGKKSDTIFVFEIVTAGKTISGMPITIPLTLFQKFVELSLLGELHEMNGVWKTPLGLAFFFSKSDLEAASKFLKENKEAA